MDNEWKQHGQPTIIIQPPDVNCTLALFSSELDQIIDCGFWQWRTPNSSVILSVKVKVHQIYYNFFANELLYFIAVISNLNSEPGSFLDFLDFFLSSPSGTIEKESLISPIRGVPGGEVPEQKIFDC